MRNSNLSPFSHIIENVLSNMFGREYYKYPQILLNSFKEMSEGYNGKKNFGQVLGYLFKIYILIFGIPEVGFQIRCLYFKDILFSNVPNNEEKKILDAGSGIGIYTFWLKKFYKGSDVTGIDVDRQKLKMSKSLAKELSVGEIKLDYGDVTLVPKKRDYDLVVSIDVLEHVKDYKKVIKNLSLYLAKGGYLYLHTPQANQKRIFKSLNNWEHEEHVHEGFTRAILKKEFESNGLKIIELRHTFGFFGKLAWELNHLLLSKSFIFAGAIYPALYVLARLDLFVKNKEGLGIAVLAKKVK